MDALPSGSINEQSLEPRVLVAVCTYNEATNITELLGRIREHVPRSDILVVDDNSPDGTPKLVREFAASDPGTRLIVREQERGLGGAIRRAVMESISGGYDYFVNLDGDLSHDPAAIPSLLAVALGPPLRDVVVGTRYKDGGSIEGWPLHRRMMSRMVNRFATRCLRLPVSDCSGSMRCYRVEALQRLDVNALRNRGYALLEELLVALDRSGATFAEVPIVFTDRTSGTSKLTLREALHSAAQIIRLSFR